MEKGILALKDIVGRRPRNSNVIFVLRHILRINNMKEVHNEKNNICNN